MFSIITFNCIKFIYFYQTISRSVQRALADHSYQFVEYLSKGGFGSCYIIKSVKFDLTFVCKVIKDTKEDKSFIQSYKREVDALIKLDHPNIVRVYDVFSEKKYLFIVLEYCSAGNIASVLSEKKRLKEDTIFRLTCELINALDYMHSLGYCHYDIKAENVLIDQYGRVKLADFGLAELITEEFSKSHTARGSLNYMAPEILLSKDHDPFKADVWALGVTIYFIATNHLPFRGSDKETVLQEIGMGYDKARKIPRFIRKILKLCLVVDHHNRATMKDIKALIQELHVSKPILPILNQQMNSASSRSAMLVKPRIQKRLSLFSVNQSMTLPHN